MKQFIKLHSKENNSLIIIAIKHIKYIEQLDSNTGSVLKLEDGSYDVNESPERIFNMLEKE